MPLFDGNSENADLADTLKGWGRPEASLFARATHRNLADEARANIAQIRFHEVTQRAIQDLGATVTSEDQQIEAVWHEVWSTPELLFVAPYGGQMAELGELATYMSETHLLDEQFAYLPPELITSFRSGEDAPPLRLERRWGEPNPADPSDRGLRAVWLTVLAESSEVESDVDDLLDCLGIQRGNATIRVRWFRLVLDGTRCDRLAIPTALDALPPFAPSPATMAFGRAVSLGSRELPELIARPVDLPEGQRIAAVGTVAHARHRDEFLQKRLGGYAH